MNKGYDVIIAGLGANGSAAAYHLSRAGYRVCGIDRFSPPHERGSSHGQSRIIRTAYYEHPLYVPLVQRAYQYWREIEHNTGASLLLQTGALMLGKPNSAVIEGSRASARTHGLPYEYLDAAAVVNKFPVLKVPAGTVGTLEPQAGILYPETCIRTFLSDARDHHASLHLEEQVLRIIPHPDSVEVITSHGKHTASSLILAAGAWMNSLLPDLQLPLSINRQVLFWFHNRNMATRHLLTPDRLPVYIWEYEKDKMFYGFPDLGDGIKIAHHHGSGLVEPDHLGNEVKRSEIEDMQQLVSRYFDAEPELNYSATCMYTNTPDDHFIIDMHPRYKNIVVASPCSGHGFKFSSLTGKMIGQLATGIAPEFDLSPFSIARFSR